MAKLISRNRLDFASGEVKHEFGLQGDILGLAPRADAGMLIVLALLIARTHRLPLADLAFAIAFPAYLMTANALRFDGNKIEQRFQPLLREGRGRWFKRYVASYALFGLALPTPFVFFAPRAVAVAAAPHLFLTAIQVRVSHSAPRTTRHASRVPCVARAATDRKRAWRPRPVHSPSIPAPTAWQCAMEGLTTHSRFAPLLRLAVPIGFNTYRLGTLGAWCAAAAATAGATRGAPAWALAWAWGALALAVGNLLLWSYNLFVFLLLRVAPQYLDPVQFGAPPVDWKWALLPLAPEKAVLPSKLGGTDDDDDTCAPADCDGGSGSIG